MCLLNDPFFAQKFPAGRERNCKEEHRAKRGKIAWLQEEKLAKEQSLLQSQKPPRRLDPHLEAVTDLQGHHG